MMEEYVYKLQVLLFIAICSTPIWLILFAIGLSFYYEVIQRFKGK